MREGDQPDQERGTTVSGYYVGQEIDGKRIKKIEDLRSGYWLFFWDGTVSIVRHK